MVAGKRPGVTMSAQGRLGAAPPPTEAGGAAAAVSANGSGIGSDGANDAAGATISGLQSEADASAAVAAAANGAAAAAAANADEDGETAAASPTIQTIPTSDLSGVLITTVQPTGSSAGLLRPGDVLLSFDGVPLANDGSVPFRARERVFFTSLVTSKPTGSSARVEVLRDGARLPPIDVPLAPLRPLVRVHCYDELPSFFVFAGLVFVPLCQAYLHEYGDGWQSAAPRRLVERALHGLASSPGEQVVILSQVLVADVNAGYQSLTNLQVLTVDGVRVKDIRALREAVLGAQGPYVVLGMEQERSLVLDLAAARAADGGVLRRYRVPYATSADLLLPKGQAGQEEQQHDGGGIVGPDGGPATAGHEAEGGALPVVVSLASAAAAYGAALGEGGMLMAPSAAPGDGSVRRA